MNAASPVSATINYTNQVEENIRCPVLLRSMANDAMTLEHCGHNVSEEAMKAIIEKADLVYTRKVEEMTLQLATENVPCPICRKRVVEIRPDTNFRNLAQIAEKASGIKPETLDPLVLQNDDVDSGNPPTTVTSPQPPAERNFYDTLTINGLVVRGGAVFIDGVLINPSEEGSSSPNSSQEVVIPIDDNAAATAPSSTASAARSATNTTENHGPVQTEPMSEHAPARTYQIGTPIRITPAAQRVNDTANNRIRRHDTPKSDHDFNEKYCCVKCWTYGAQEQDVLREGTAYNNQEYGECLAWAAIARIRRLGACIVLTPIKAMHALVCGCGACCICHFACAAAMSAADTRNVRYQQDEEILEEIIDPCGGACGYTWILCGEVWKNIFCCIPECCAPEITDRVCHFPTANRGLEKARNKMWDMIKCCSCDDDD